MSSLELDVEQWAEKQFGSCALGDRRRTRRAVKVATQMASFPNGSLPNQIECWSDLKAAYRLFDQDDVTFEALAKPHWDLTRGMAQGTCLVINDTMETDFGIHRHVEGLGPTGDGRGRGFMLHSSLLVQADTREVVGLAAQELFYRRPTNRAKENSYQRTQRPRESEVWGRVIDRVGPPAPSVKYLHVCDRGADNIEVFCHCRQQQAGWVIRATQLKRLVETPDGEKTRLDGWLAAQPILGTYKMSLRATAKQAARPAKFEVRAAPVVMILPKRQTPYLRQIGQQRIVGWVVEAHEVGAPKGVKPLHWVLYTSERVESFEDAWRILEYYECRWLIEEFHKAIKTGCRLEMHLQVAARRLEAVAGMVSVLAVRLLQMKSIANKRPETKAERVIPETWLTMLRSLRKAPISTVRDFVRHLAGLGGFLMRKGDGEPGWITLWRGVDKLLLCLRGASAITKKCG